MLIEPLLFILGTDSAPLFQSSAIFYRSRAGSQIEGMIEREQPIEISIHPLRPDKAFIEIPLARLGIDNFYVRLHVRIWR
jgi:hypothetical protein